MFSLCVCSRSRKADINPAGKHYKAVQKTLSPDEQLMLELVYNDLASRNHDNLLSFENFLLFFGLTGLWGAKLFRKFDEQSRKLITKEEFFYGLSRTAKAPHSQKIKQLFNFFKDEEDNGIKYIDFTKMLYNYSRDELKEILMEDKYMIPELNRTISKNIGSTQPTSASLVSVKSYLQKPLLQQKETVIELNYEEPKKEEVTCFGKNYAEFSQYRDPGTILEVKLNDFTYKVNYCNMITLVKEFAKKIYSSYQIDIKTGIFTYEQFTEWIQSHRKLFETYYTSFHIDIWSYCDGQPNFLSKIQRSFVGKMLDNKKISDIYAMLVGDVLIISESYNTRRYPIKVICLEGLNMVEIYDKTGYGIEIYHRDQYYQKCTLYFKSKSEQNSYLESFQVYEGDTLHDLYDSHEMIGTGKFSIVYRCTSKQTSKTYALKDISTQKLTSQAIATLDNESEIMKIISHPQIVKYQETIRSKSHIYIIAEYIYGKDLYEYVRKRKRLSEYISAFIIGKVIEATIYLHSLQIIHRDLKPENIMVMLKKRGKSLSSSSSLDQFTDEECIENIKIIDFGLANHLSELEKTEQKHGIAGTPNYIAPEIILGEKPSNKSDIFSIGSILYFLLSGKLAFAYHNMELTLLRTARGEYDMNDSIWDGISQEAKNLVSQLLCVDPEHRIGLEEALNHRWFDVVTKKRGENSATTSQNNSESEGETMSNKKESNNIKLETLKEINVEAIVEEELKNKMKKSRQL